MQIPISDVEAKFPLCQIPHVFTYLSVHASRSASIDKRNSAVCLPCVKKNWNQLVGPASAVHIEFNVLFKPGLRVILARESSENVKSPKKIKIKKFTGR